MSLSIEYAPENMLNAVLSVPLLSESLMSNGFTPANGENASYKNQNVNVIGYTGSNAVVLAIPFAIIYVDRAQLNSIDASNKFWIAVIIGEIIGWFVGKQLKKKTSNEF